MYVRKAVIFGLSLVCGAGSARGVTTWKGGELGNWDVSANWAGGFPLSNSTVRLNHDRQTNAYTVIVQTPAITDKLWIDTYTDLTATVESVQFYQVELE